MTAEETLIKTLGVEVAREEIKTKSGVLHSVVAGQGDDLLLLHGINIGWGEWYPNIAALAKYFKVHAIDLPGSGKSMKINPRAKDFSSTLVSAVEDYISVKKFSKVHLVGHSFGAWIALKIMIAKNPAVDKAVLESPLGFTRKTPLRYRAVGSRPLAIVLSKTVMRPTRKNIEKFLKGVFYDAGALAPQLVDYYYDNISAKNTAHPFLMMNRFAGVLRVKDEFNLIEAVHTIDRPVLIIVGENDPIVSFNQTHQKSYAALRNAKVEHLAKTGHVPSIERADDFNRLTIDFLRA